MANVARTSKVAKAEMTGNNISSLSERSTAALALVSSQLRVNFSNIDAAPRVDDEWTA